jgi:hypothetical protein
MEYVRDPSKLARVAKTLASHEMETKGYYLSTLGPRVKKLDNVRDRLLVLFTIANKQRRGVGKDNTKLKNAAARFYQGIDQKVRECTGINSQKAHSVFLEWLCDIEGMDQKTANLFLKWLTMFHNDFELGLLDWQSWKPYLHVPLDRWLVRLIGEKYLNVCTENYDKDFLQAKTIPGVRKNEYKRLQEEFAEAALLVQESAIAMDVLWFVGVMYCSYHPLFCHLCWVGEECGNNYEIPDLQRVPTKSKSERREERREEGRQRNALMKEYMKEHPDEVERIRKKHGLA